MRRELGGFAGAPGSKSVARHQMRPPGFQSARRDRLAANDKARELGWIV